MDIQRVSAGFRAALGFVGGFFGSQFLRNGSSFFYSNQPLWATGTRPNQNTNALMSTWEENVFQLLSEHVGDGGVHPRTKKRFTRQQGLEGARILAREYVRMTQKVAEERVGLQDGGGGFFGRGGWSGWTGNYSSKVGGPGCLCRDWTEELSDLQNVALKYGWEVNRHENNSKFGAADLLTLHSFFSASFLGNFTTTRIQTPDVILDPWPNSRPDVYDPSKHGAIWPIWNVDPSLDSN